LNIKDESMQEDFPATFRWMASGTCLFDSRALGNLVTRKGAKKREGAEEFFLCAFCFFFAPLRETNKYADTF
jgi:hypothetical protein